MAAITIGHGAEIALRLANRHGLVTGATGTGKTVTLQTLAEQFSAAGVPVFAADIKGDLSGIATAFPVRFWDLFGSEGLAMRTSVHEVGPALMARLLGLNDTQTGVLNIAFRWSVDTDRHMLSLDDLRAVVTDMMDNAERLRTSYGNVTAASVGAIQRNLLTLEVQGGRHLFGEPSLNIMDLLARAPDGRGMVNLLSADRLMEAPKLYGSFLLFLLTKLFATLPEVGDLDRPKLVFFFDEAHLLFANAPRPLMEMIERLVRLIRSKGVGVYFVTQSPLDVPAAVLAQLGNRVQHALRAFTPKDARNVKAIAATYRAAPGVDTEDAISNMGVGEALVSPLMPGGVPAPVARVRVQKPTAQIGPVSDVERHAILRHDPLFSRYSRELTGHDAYLAFLARVAPQRLRPKAAPTPVKAEGWWSRLTRAFAA